MYGSMFDDVQRYTWLIQSHLKVTVLVAHYGL
jgi:hypothetical protein